MQKLIVFAALGTEIGLLIVLASWIENVLGERYRTNGLIFLGLTLIFLVAWFIQIIYLLRRLQASTPRESSGSSSPPTSPSAD